ncbi:hypothetical protein QYF36_000879 [Acer negundo]|nr:hypothetical protein QYF36_000879 [Acer negundo]
MRWLMLWMSVLVRTTSYQSLLLQDPDEVGHDVWNLIKPFLENLKMSWKTGPCDPSSGKLKVPTDNQANGIKYLDEECGRKAYNEAARSREEAEEEEDEEPMPSWAWELFRSNRELSRRNMELATEVRGLKETIARYLSCFVTDYPNCCHDGL